MNHSKRYAIIGGGFSGLALAHALFQEKSGIEVTLFDPQGFGGEASKISTGLLHKYVGQSGKQNPYGVEGEASTKALIAQAETALGRSLVLSSTLLRIPFNEEQSASFQHSQTLYNDLEWLEASQVQALHPGLPQKPGLLIHSGLTLDVTGYLEGLARIVQSQGLKLEKRRIQSISELNNFDHILIAVGAASFPELESIKIAQVKGQLLELSYPQNLPPLPFSLIGPVYITMSADRKKAIVGATYEHHFTDAAPDPEFAIKSLLPKAEAFFPSLRGQTVLDVRAGIRASTPSRLPFAGKINDRVHALVGMGSRGLLYHAYFANQLVKSL